mgnify:CR=1 FL=1
MSLNAQVSAERVHIGFFGLRNAGKSSLVNRVTGQTLSIVSEVRGTTTDPVRKAMELLPVGPVVIIDTPGLDDEGALGEERVRRTRRVLDQTDIAVLVVDAAAGLSQADRELMQLFEGKRIPFVVAMNKADLVSVPESVPENTIYVSAQKNENIYALKEKIAALARSAASPRELIADLVSSGDAVVLVTPIDSAAPKGRLILPQQQTIRALLDAGCVPVVTRETELSRTLSLLSEPPALVVTDSQAFGIVSKTVPESVRLTSFSILFARYKGDLRTAVLGAADIDKTHRNVLVTHQFVTGAQTCDSEELSVGGTDNVDVSVFDDFDYVALGHIHGPQKIGHETVRYCGTPLKYSFSEVGHKKSVTVVELAEKGSVAIRTVPLVPKRDMSELRGAYNELMLRENYEGKPFRNDYLRITLTDEEDIPNAVNNLRTVYPYIMRLDYDNRRTRTESHVDGAEQVERKRPLTLFEEFYESQNGQPMSEEQRSFAKQLMERIWEGKE